MAPTYRNGSPSGGSQERSPVDSPAVPIPLPRRRRTTRRRTLRFALRRRPARPSTVWPCAQDDPREGTGLLANWLLTAVIKIVTTYTQPGQRVLLLEPAPYLTPPAPGSAATGQNRSRHAQYAGLREAGWTVVRLGRGVQTQTAVAPADADGERPGDPSAESESGPRPRTDDPISDQPAEPSAHRRPGPHPTANSSGPDRYDLVITATGPRTLNWFRPADWARLLTPAGTLAVITHGDQVGDRLTDPAGSLVRAAQQAGLRYLDRIALLRVPIRDDALTVPISLRRPSSQAVATPARRTQVHDDLLVFTRRPTPADVADGEETSDD